MSFRQVSEYVYVRLEDIDKVSAIVADVNDMLEEHPEMGDYLIFRFDSYGEYSLKLYLYAYTSGAITAYTDYMRVKQDLLRSEEHTSDLPSLMHISSAVFCLKKKNNK